MLCPSTKRYCGRTAHDKSAAATDANDCYSFAAAAVFFARGLAAERRGALAARRRRSTYALRRLRLTVTRCCWPMRPLL